MHCQRGRPCPTCTEPPASVLTEHRALGAYEPSSRQQQGRRVAEFETEA